MVRSEVIHVLQNLRPVVSKEDSPKKTSLAAARLFKLCIILSTVVGNMIDWFVARSRSFSDHPAPFFDFRCRSIASLKPLEQSGDGLPNSRLQKLFGVSARSQRKLP